MPEPTERPKVIDLAEEVASRQKTEAIAQLRTILARPQTPIPEDELDLLGRVALGDTGQSRTCRYLLCLLVGEKEPGGFDGEGLLEMRTLDARLAEAFLKILDWWRGPTKSDEPLYAILRKIEAAFQK